MPAVAIVGAAALGAGASIISGNKAANAQKDAANQATQVQLAQNAEAKRQYDQNRADLAPYRDAGYTALGQIGAGTKAGGEFNRNFTMADFRADPGYAFRTAEGMRGLEASAAARGGALSGGALKAIARYNQDAASQEYGAAYNRYNNDTTTRYNRLASIAGVGQTATNSGIAAGNDYVSQLQQGANNITSNINAAGNARASQYANTGQAIGGAINSIGSYYSMKDLYNNPGGAIQNYQRLSPSASSTIAANPGIF